MTYWLPQTEPVGGGDRKTALYWQGLGNSSIPEPLQVYSMARANSWAEGATEKLVDYIWPISPWSRLLSSHQEACLSK